MRNIFQKQNIKLKKMRISKPYLNETHQELITLTVECPYCESVRKYRSIRNNTFNAVCKVCKEQFIVDHMLDDYCLLQSGYQVYYVGNRVPEYKNVPGITTSEIIYDETTEEERIWVTYPDGKSFCFNIYHVEIDKVLNKELWKYSENG